jgi:hypothetical protein
MEEQALCETEQVDTLSESETTDVSLSETIQESVEMILRHLIFWESDDKKIGMIVQLIHHAFIYGMVLWYFYLHIFSDSYLSYVLFCSIFFLVWIQHLCCGACLLYNMEQKLIGNHPDIVDNILHIFHIPLTEEGSNGVLLLISSLIMVMLISELVSRTISGITYWI